MLNTTDCFDTRFLTFTHGAPKWKPGGQTIEPDARTVVKTDRVFDPKAAAVIDQENVNQYIFNDDGQRVEAGGNYKMEDARYR